MEDQHRKGMCCMQTHRQSSPYTKVNLWDGQNILKLKMQLVLLVSRQSTSTLTKVDEYDTRAPKGYVQVSQKPMCYIVTECHFSDCNVQLYTCEFQPPVLLQVLFHHLWSCPLRNYPAAFGQKLVSIYKRLITEKHGLPSLPSHIPSAEECFNQMQFDDTWKDAEMASVCHWLRGGKGLAVPPSFRFLLPVKL